MTSHTPITTLPLAAGDILVSRWGIWQDNIDFYQVTRVMPKMVDVAAIGDRVLRETGFLGQVIEPVPDDFRETPRRRKVYSHRGTPWVMVTPQLGAKPWDGEPRIRTFTY